MARLLPKRSSGVNTICKISFRFFFLSVRCDAIHTLHAQALSPCLSHIMRCQPLPDCSSLPPPPAIHGGAFLVSACTSTRQAGKQASRADKAGSALALVSRGVFCGVADPRVLNMRVCMCMCMQSHNFDRGRHVKAHQHF